MMCSATGLGLGPVLITELAAWIFPGGHEANADDPVHSTWNNLPLLGWGRMRGIAWSNDTIRNL